MQMSGSGGKKDSTIARITGAMGPRPPKPSSRAFQNSSVPSWWSQPIIVVISIPRVPSLSFFFSISGFYDAPVNKIRAFFVISPILRNCGGVSCTGRGSLCFSVGFSGGLFGPGLHPLDLLGAHPFPTGKSGFVRDLDTAGKAPVQAVPPGQLIALEQEYTSRCCPFSARYRPVADPRRTPGSWQ